MEAFSKKLAGGLASLKLTIVCLMFALVLVLAGTLAQVHLGTQIVQKHFFQSLVVWWPVEDHGFRFPIFPGGHLIGAVLLVNLIAAHLRRFRWTWHNLGIHLTHLGLIIMLAGALFTDLFSVESEMRISQGETKNYAVDASAMELAVIDTSNSEYDQVTAIPFERLRPGGLISDPGLPFSIAVRRVAANAELQMLSQAGPNAKPAASQAQGSQIAMTELPRATAQNDRSIPCAVIEIIPVASAKSESKGSLGTWLVSEALGGPQIFSCDGRQWSIALRPTRHYKPYSITLNKFTHERYAGTDIASNYASSVLLDDPENNTSRDVLIYMNHPLRYCGDTFYQASFADNDTTSILQVVHNPAVVAPYLGCLVVGAGLLFQFSLHLIRFSRRIRKESAV